MDSLAIALTRTLRGELEKARVLFTWIAQNVRYDCRKFHERRDFVIEARDEEDFQAKLTLRRGAQAQKTMRRKRGICGDYSQLYKAMCDAVGLEAVIVVGDARDQHRPYRNKHDHPHAWRSEEHSLNSSH